MYREAPELHLIPKASMQVLQTHTVPCGSDVKPNRHAHTPRHMLHKECVDLCEWSHSQPAGLAHTRGDVSRAQGLGMARGEAGGVEGGGGGVMSVHMEHLLFQMHIMSLGIPDSHQVCTDATRHKLQESALKTIHAAAASILHTFERKSQSTGRTDKRRVGE